jgi:AbrB family looped-hinge helix DNA binding protein
VKVSSKYQLVIPKEIRESAGIAPGATFEMIAYGGRIELIPVDSIQKLKGAFPDVDTRVERERDRT